MAQPAQVGIIECAQVRDAVFQHRHPLDPHAERKALILGRVDAAVLEYLRMNHTAAEDYEPMATGADLELTGAPRAADVILGRGFGEWEIARPEAYRQVVESEERTAELDQ